MVNGMFCMILTTCSAYINTHCSFNQIFPKTKVWKCTVGRFLVVTQGHSSYIIYQAVPSIIYHTSGCPQFIYHTSCCSQYHLSSIRPSSLSYITHQAVLSIIYHISGCPQYHLSYIKLSSASYIILSLVSYIVHQAVLSIICHISGFPQYHISYIRLS